MITHGISRLLMVGAALVLCMGEARAQGGRAGNPPDPDQLFTANNTALVGVESPDKQGAKVYVIETGTWAEYRTPEKTRVRPVAGANYIALMPVGPKITQLAAFSAGANKWTILDLPGPAETSLEGPILSPNMAVYYQGRHVYAFSAMAAKWGVLELPEGAEAHPITTFQVATVLHENHLYIFNPRLGRWDDSGSKPK